MGGPEVQLDGVVEAGLDGGETAIDGAMESDVDGTAESDANGAMEPLLDGPAASDIAPDFGGDVAGPEERLNGAVETDAASQTGRRYATPRRAIGRAWVRSRAFRP